MFYLPGSKTGANNVLPSLTFTYYILCTYNNVTYLIGAYISRKKIKIKTPTKTLAI